MNQINEAINGVKLDTSGVYLIQCIENGKNYIGSAKCIRTRWRTHIRELDKDTHHSIELQNDWIKYGMDKFKFEVLLECSYADSKKYEMEYINKFNSNKFGYNMSSLKDSFRKRNKLIGDNILKYAIKNGYKNDGNVYWFNIFDCAENLNITTTKLLKFFRINSLKCWNVMFSINEEDYIGLNWDNEDGVQVIVLHKSFFELENTKIIKCF